MANKNNDRQQPPPNPFLLSSSTTTASNPGFLFSRNPGTGEAGNTGNATPSTTTTTVTTTVSFTLPAATSNPSFVFGRATGIGEAGNTATATTTAVPFGHSTNTTSFTPPLFTTQSQSGAFGSPFSSSTLRPSSSTLPTVSVPSKEPVVSGGIFGNAHVKTQSSLFGGIKSGSGPKEAESGATEPSRPSVSSVFGGSSIASGSDVGAPSLPPPPQEELEEGEIVEADFGSGGVGGAVSVFGQVPASSWTAPYKEAKSTSAFSPRKGEGVIASKVFSGQTSRSSSKPLPSLLSKTSTSPFKAMADTSKDSFNVEEAAVSPREYPLNRSKDRDEGQSSPPENDRKELTKVIVDEIPDNCLDKEFLKAHFSKFGEIKRLMVSSHIHRATVLYNTHHAASKAKRKGGKLHPKMPEVKIYYGTPARRKSKDSTSTDAVQAKKKAIRTLQQAHQSCDLDPYTPLQRPGVESPPPKKLERIKPATQRLGSSKAEPCSAPAATSHLLVKKKKVLKSSSERETKEATKTTSGETNLTAVLDRVTQNNNDRYTVLKARDKLLRKERHRTSDLQQASYLAATCPDMCPELERYMRDTQYDLSATFEMTNGVLDHRLVTKKFSRSSADKDLPLPHELRPGPVLLRTMDFLVCNVISRVDEEGMEKDVWYNYLWNRTRAVRNDLMQQQLTDSDAVAIMERCTRFHIYAAARLCEEPPDLYDDKMNTEHLTKSLQTLKELYHDLGEQGRHFSSEAEFRAYEMLLNLNDGEAIVNKYAQFREEVQKSTQVQFALKVILALTFNNYVKFFKLIRGSATYLQGCLLHRYFRQVRSRGLETIVKSYMPPKVPQTIPLQTITHILGFESEVEARLYLRAHGIKVSDGSVFLGKNSFIQNPEELPPPLQPINLVEVNRKVSVGEVIQGGPIPSNPLYTHIPHNSFDEQGCLKAEARNASDQCGAVVRMPLDVDLAPVVQQQPIAMQNYELLSHMKDVFSLVEGLVLPQMLREVTEEVVEAARQKVATQSVAAEILAEGVRREVAVVAKEGYSELEHEEKERKRKQQEEEEQQRKALQKIRKIVADELYTKYKEEFLQSYMRKICKKVISEVSEEVALQELKSELPHMISEEVVLSEATVLCEEVIQELTAELELKVEAFMKRVALRRMSQHFKVWWIQTQKAQRRKQSQITFPAACSSLSLQQQSQALGWGYPRDPEHNLSAPQLAKLENSNKDALMKLTVRNLLMKECALQPLSLQHQLATLVDRAIPDQHNLVTQYFKVVVCWHEEVRPEVIVWLRNKLRVVEGTTQTDRVEEVFNTTFSFVSRQSGLEYGWVIKEVSALALDIADLRGAGLVLFVSGEDRHSASYDSIRELLLLVPGMSFFEVNFEGGEGGIVEGWSLVKDDLLKPETSSRLQSLLLEYWGQQSERVCVASARLSDLTNELVVQHFLEPVLKKQAERAVDNRSPLPPSAMIDLYNSVLDMLVLALTDDELYALSWPPPELTHLPQCPPLTWNSEDASQAAHLVSSVKLPPLQLQEGLITWTQLTRLVHEYAANVSQSGGGEAPVLVSHINAILADTRANLEYLMGEYSPDIHPLMAPWPQIINVCASCKLLSLPSSKIYYQPKRLHLRHPASWITACRSSEPSWKETIQGSYTCTSRKRKVSREEEEEEKENRKLTKSRTVHSDFLDDIAAEKQKCTEFERNLESSMLDVEEELKLLFNTSYN